MTARLGARGCLDLEAGRRLLEQVRSRSVGGHVVLDLRRVELADLNGFAALRSILRELQGKGANVQIRTSPTLRSLQRLLGHNFLRDWENAGASVEREPPSAPPLSCSRSRGSP